MHTLAHTGTRTHLCLIMISIGQALALDDLKIGLFKAITGLGFSLILLLIINALRGEASSCPVCPLSSLKSCGCHQPPTHVSAISEALGTEAGASLPRCGGPDASEEEATSPTCPPILGSSQLSLNSQQRPEPVFKDPVGYSTALACRSSESTGERLDFQNIPPFQFIKHLMPIIAPSSSPSPSHATDRMQEPELGTTKLPVNLA